MNRYLQRAWWKYWRYIDTRNVKFLRPLVGSFAGVYLTHVNMVCCIASLWCRQCGHISESLQSSKYWWVGAVFPSGIYDLGKLPGVCLWHRLYLCEGSSPCHFVWKFLVYYALGPTKKASSYGNGYLRKPLDRWVSELIFRLGWLFEPPN